MYFAVAGIQKRTKKWNQFIITFATFLIGCSILPIPFAIFQAYLTVQGRFSFILYSMSNSICPLETYLTCKLLTFVLTASLYFFIAFHVSASISAAVVNAALLLNMVIGCINNLTTKNFNCRTIHMYQKIYIVLKFLEPMATLISTILLLMGFGTSVTCNFMSIRMLGVVPMPFYLYIPVAAVSAIIGIGTLLPYSTVCHAKSSKLLAGWKYCGGRERGYVDKMVNGLRPIGFQVGFGGSTYFVLKRSTKSKYYSAILDGTFNILLA